jgi:diguanylate cyclase (GGDEF)-like protein
MALSTKLRKNLSANSRPQTTAPPTRIVAGSTPDAILAPVRATPWQEAVRTFITFVPFATAVAGSAAIQLVPTDRYAEMLPPLFFVGALIVTAAMLHQRHLLQRNVQLNDDLQTAHQRLDTLHHLSLELSTSLNVSQVAQTILEHAMRSMDAGRGTLWLETEFASPLETEHVKAGGEKSAGDKRWRVFAFGQAPGEKTPTLQQLENGVWRAALENGDHTLQCGHDTVYVPINWKEGERGAILMKSLRRPCSEEGKTVLRNIALIAAPALQNSLLYRSASVRAEVDGLTRLINHRAIHERLGQEVARVQRAREANADAAFSIASLDITDFKLFNDTYGHPVGDEVLRRVSECLRHTFRISDVVGRFGGDEFLVLLPDTPRAGADILCERVLQLIASQPFVVADGSPITIRLNCGVACYGDDGVHAAELLHAADERLYQAKRKGDGIVAQIKKAAPPPLARLQPDWRAVGLLETLVATIDAKDHYTRDHCERVWNYALLVAHQLDFDRDMMEALHLCSLVHDVGKIVIPDAILRKPGRLSDDEFEVMQRHTIFGAMIVRELPHLPLVLGGVRHHHEHWDGTGYPDKIAGEAIPLLGRVLAVADGFAAMTLQRPYRRALSLQQALKEVEAQKGKRYDPEIVSAFTAMLHALPDGEDALQKALAEKGLLHFAREQAPDYVAREVAAA